MIYWNGIYAPGTHLCWVTEVYLWMWNTWFPLEENLQRVSYPEVTLTDLCRALCPSTNNTMQSASRKSADFSMWKTDPAPSRTVTRTVHPHLCLVLKCIFDKAHVHLGFSIQTKSLKDIVKDPVLKLQRAAVTWTPSTVPRPHRTHVVLCLSAWILPASLRPLGVSQVSGIASSRCSNISIPAIVFSTFADEGRSWCCTRERER